MQAIFSYNVERGELVTSLYAVSSTLYLFVVLCVFCWRQATASQIKMFTLQRPNFDYSSTVNQLNFNCELKKIALLFAPQQSCLLPNSEIESLNFAAENKRYNFVQSKLLMLMLLVVITLNQSDRVVVSKDNLNNYCFQTEKFMSLLAAYTR